MGLVTFIDTFGLLTASYQRFKEETVDFTLSKLFSNVLCFICTEAINFTKNVAFFCKLQMAPTHTYEGQFIYIVNSCLSLSSRHFYLGKI